MKKKDSAIIKLPNARVITLCTTKEYNITYYGIEVEGKIGTNYKGEPIISPDYNYVSEKVRKFNNANKRH